MELGVPEVRTACCSSHSLVRPPVEWDRSGAVRAPLWDAHSTWCHLRASGGGLMRQTATLASRHCVTYYRSAVRFQISCGQVCFRGTIRAFASTTTIGAPSVRRSIRSCRRFSWSFAGPEGIASSTRGQRFRPIHVMSSAAFSLSGMASSLAAAIRIASSALGKASVELIDTPSGYVIVAWNPLLLGVALSRTSMTSRPNLPSKAGTVRIPFRMRAYTAWKLPSHPPPIAPARLSTKRPPRRWMRPA